MEPTHLRNPPIVEAMIELRVERESDAESFTLESFGSGIEERFPMRQERVEVQVVVPLPLNGQAMTALGHPDSRGLVYFSESRDRAVQVSGRLFAFSRLRSYTSWGELRDETRDLWARYVELVKPKRVVHLSVRFINQLELPLAGANVDDFLLAFPQHPQGLPPMVRSVMQTVLTDPESGAGAIVTQTIAPSETSSNFLVGFDINAQLGVDERPDASELWTRFESLRVLKNRIFFESLTPRALEAYR